MAKEKDGFKFPDTEEGRKKLTKQLEREKNSGLSPAEKKLLEELNRKEAGKKSKGKE